MRTISDHSVARASRCWADLELGLAERHRMCGADMQAVSGTPRNSAVFKVAQGGNSPKAADVRAAGALQVAGRSQAA